MKCIDDESMGIFGNYDTGVAYNLMIVFEKCDPQKNDFCKSEEEIHE